MTLNQLMLTCIILFSILYVTVAKPGFYHDDHDDHDLHASETHYKGYGGGYGGGYAVVKPVYVVPVYVVPAYGGGYGGGKKGGYGGRGRKGYKKGGHWG